MANRKLVLVEWLDSRRGEGWVRLDELESSVTRCLSVGWIVAKDRTSVTLAGHLGENPDQCCGDLTIPKKAVVRMTSLTIPSERQPTNLISRASLLRRLRRSRETRARFLDSNLSKELAFQLRQLRDNKGWSQPELAKMTDTSQNAISRLENPNYGKATLTTLKKLAGIYDVGLVVRFVPFSQLLNWESGTPYIERGLSPSAIDVPSFEEEDEDEALDNALR